jgi:hypothetical protein
MTTTLTLPPEAAAAARAAEQVRMEQHRSNIVNIKTALQLTADVGKRALLWRMLTDEMGACHAAMTGEMAS